MQDVIVVPNEVAAELAGVSDTVLDSLRDRLGCSISLRGNKLTLDGEGEPRRRGTRGRRRARRARRGRPRNRPRHRRRCRCRARPGGDIRDIFEDVVWRHRGKKIAPKTVTQKRYVDAIRGSTVTFGDRPGGNGQDVSRDRARCRGAEREAGRAPDPHAACRRGGRAARLPARRHAREGRPVHAAALRCALRHDGRRPADGVHGPRHDRGGAARVHARAHAERLVRHPRRGAEHDARSRCRCSSPGSASGRRW